MSESDLPAYTEVDHFSGTPTSQQEPSTAQQSTVNESTTTQNGAETETTEIPLEDVPLLSDDDGNQS